jgi:hypothetical protein
MKHRHDELTATLGDLIERHGITAEYNDDPSPFIAPGVPETSTQFWLPGDLGHCFAVVHGLGEVECQWYVPTDQTHTMTIEINANWLSQVRSLVEAWITLWNHR